MGHIRPISHGTHMSHLASRDLFCTSLKLFSNFLKLILSLLFVSKKISKQCFIGQGVCNAVCSILIASYWNHRESRFYSIAKHSIDGEGRESLMRSTPKNYETTREHYQNAFLHILRVRPILTATTLGNVPVPWRCPWGLLLGRNQIRPSDSVPRVEISFSLMLCSADSSYVLIWIYVINV